MALFSTYLGGIDDRVRITLGASEARAVESYTVKQSVLTQPSTWSIRLGHGGVIKDMIKLARPGTDYTLLIGDVLQQTGKVEKRSASGDGNGSTLTISGRDALTALIKAHVVADESFTNETYAELVQKVIAKVYPKSSALTFTNQGNRSIQAGTDVIQSDLPINPRGVPTHAATERPLRAKAGERWYSFIRKQLDRAGLFLFAGADGSLILTAPNANQPPIARIVRRRGQTRNEGNVVAYTFNDDTSNRYDSVYIHGRVSGEKAGRQKTTGAFSDPEMASYGFPPAPMVIRDKHIDTPAQAELYARRKISEARRASWNLTYTLAGHTVPKIDGKDSIVWAVDTVVEVDDQELDIQDVFWVEAVEFSRGPDTKTMVTLMRPGDLLFGGEDE